MMLIRDFVDEHERALDHCDRALRAADSGDFDTAHAQLALMTELLLAHWQGEEQGLFAVMSREQEYADYIAPLVAEHRELEAFLRRADLSDPADRARLRQEEADLVEHISREEDGLFPASLVMLTGEEWDRAADAWRAAHPGQELQV